MLSVTDADRMRTLAAEKSLYFFVRMLWPVLEPQTPFTEGWWPAGWCAHLEAVADGEITRIIANVPPGSTKSLLTSVFFPAWMWGPRRRPSHRFLTAAYSQTLTERDNDRMRTLITSKEYQKRWGDVFRLTGEGKVQIANNRTGWKLASSIGGTITGQRGDTFIIDDPNNIADTESKLIRDATNRWLSETMPTRLNNLDESSIIIIQQRTHQEDATGFLLDPERGGDKWTLVMCPMEYDPDWACGETALGWTDPRAEKGELFWPQRFSPQAVIDLKASMSEYAWAGQMQQHPEPRGGAIIKRDWWKLYGKADQDPQAAGLKFPPFSFVVASLDCALTDKTDNDPSALVVLGVWIVPQTATPAVMLMHVSTVHAQISDLVRHTTRVCEKYHANQLLIEAKANGHSVYHEIRRLNTQAPWNIELVDPTPHGGKVARVHSITHLFEQGMLWHPNTAWADDCIAECAIFPRGAHDDRVDALSMGLRWLRDRGVLSTSTEKRWHEQAVARSVAARRGSKPLYPV